MHAQKKNPEVGARGSHTTETPAETTESSYTQPAGVVNKEQQCLDLLLQHKGTALSATAWECYIRGGRGALLTNGKDTVYLPRTAMTHHSGLTRRDIHRLLHLTQRYDPQREIVLVIPWSDQPWLIRRVVMPVKPETAFLQSVGTPELPPLQPLYAGEGGTR